MDGMVAGVTIIGGCLRFGPIAMFSLRDRKSPQDETAKLTATYVNGMAIGMVVVGGVAPFINVAISGYPLSSIRSLLASGMICIGLSAALHSMAQW